MTGWTTTATAMPVPLFCARVVVQTWRGPGQEHARCHGFRETTVHQLLWPGQQVDTGACASPLLPLSGCYEGNTISRNSSFTGQTISPDRTHHGCINGQLSTSEQSKAIHNDPNAPGIPCNWNGQVKIANHPVGGNVASTFSTNASDGTLHCKTPSSQRPRTSTCCTVVAKGIDGAATPAYAR